MINVSVIIRKLKLYELAGNAKPFFFLKIWFAILLVLFGFSFFFTKNLVIYAQQDDPDYIQVYFKIDGAYGEENSERTRVFEKSINGEKINFPRGNVDYIRIDPASHKTSIVINKIELVGVLGSEVFTPDDLLVRIRPLQMIDKVELTESGLLINSTGNDPAFELWLNRPHVLSAILKYVSLSFVISAVFYFIFATLSFLKLDRDKICFFLVPLVTSLFIITVFYPGGMSFDTFHALRSSRNDVTDSMWPPMVSYVWRLVDLISTNPSLMHFVQVYILIFAVFSIVFLFTRKILPATIFLIIYLSVPVVLGTVSVIWKDVLMAAFLFAGFALIMRARFIKNVILFLVCVAVSLFFIFVGSCARHNAITGAVPLIFFVAWSTCARFVVVPKYKYMATLLLGSVLTSAVFVSKTYLDNYSLPSLTKLNNSTGEFIRMVRVMDIAGASLCVKENLFTDVAADLTLDEISYLYDPRHVNLSQGLLKRVEGVKSIDDIWLKVANNHPFCFLSNKIELAKYLVGANSGEQFIITHPAIDPNEYGYKFDKSSIRDFFVNYIVEASSWAGFKPWFIYVLSIFLVLARFKFLSIEHFVLFISAAFYFAGLVLFGNAADARLAFYTTTSLLVFSFVLLLDKKS